MHNYGKPVNVPRTYSNHNHHKTHITPVSNLPKPPAVNDPYFAQNYEVIGTTVDMSKQTLLAQKNGVVFTRTFDKELTEQYPNLAVFKAKASEHNIAQSQGEFEVGKTITTKCCGGTLKQILNIKQINQL